MGKKKNNDDGNGDGHAEDLAQEPVYRQPDPEPRPIDPRPLEPRQRGFFPALTIGDILALLTLIVLSAALLLEGYHKEFRDYSKEIIALFAVVVGFLLGRKT